MVNVGGCSDRCVCTMAVSIIFSMAAERYHQGGFGFFFKDIRSNFFLRPPRAEPTDRGGNNIPNMEITYLI
jgi:hypothetical protein